MAAMTNRALTVQDYEDEEATSVTAVENLPVCTTHSLFILNTERYGI